MTLRTITIALSSIILLGMIGFVAHMANDDVSGKVFAMTFFLPFYGFPLIVSIVLSARFKKEPASQVFLAIASLLYALWFVYAMHDAFYVHLDPQSGLVIIFVGIYALPILLPLWIVAFLLNNYVTKSSDPGDSAEYRLNGGAQSADET